MGRHKLKRDWKMVTDVPQNMTRVAQNRVRFMLLNFHVIDFDLMRLAVSAYLQGIADAAEVAFNQGFVPQGIEVFNDIGSGI